MALNTQYTLTHNNHTIITMTSKDLYHVDFDQLSGDAGNFLFFWKELLEREIELSDLAVKTNQAIQATKADPPYFLQEYIKQEKQRLKQTKSRLNQWIAQHANPKTVPPLVFELLKSVNIETDTRTKNALLKQTLMEIEKVRNGLGDTCPCEDISDDEDDADVWSRAKENVDLKNELLTASSVLTGGS